MRHIAVIGSRSFKDYGRLSADLNRARSAWGDFVVVSGGACGADSLAVRWANENGLPDPVIFLPNYSVYGRRAPLERNKQIIAAAEAIIAFWDNVSRGTAHAIELARQAGKPVYVRSGGYAFHEPGRRSAWDCSEAKSRV